MRQLLEFLLLVSVVINARGVRQKVENSFQFIIVETSSVESRCQYCPGAH